MFMFLFFFFLLKIYAKMGDLGKSLIQLYAAEDLGPSNAEGNEIKVKVDLLF